MRWFRAFGGTRARFALRRISPFGAWNGLRRASRGWFATAGAASEGSAVLFDRLSERARQSRAASETDPLARVAARSLAPLPTRVAALAAVVALASGGAEAQAWRIGLMALAPGGDRAILAYNAEWVEVDFDAGAGTLLTPPPTCSWTSATYDPAGTGFALTAHCVADLDCQTIRAGVWKSDPDWGLVNIARVFGKRWNEAYWRAGRGGGDILVTETPIAAPLATGLGDLGVQDGCEQGPGRLVSVSAADGRIAQLDILPGGWPAIAVIAADRRRIAAKLRVTDRGGRDTAAEAEIAAFCAGETDGDWRAPVCYAGLPMRVEWTEGDWRLEPEATGGWSRLAISADFAVAARESCEGETVNGRLRTSCAIVVTRPGGALEISSEDGLFGDIRLSADGRWLGTLAAGRGFPFRRFDLIDTATGERRDLARLLDLGPPWGAAR